MEAAGSQSDAITSDAAPQSEQEAEMDDAVVVALSHVKDAAFEEADDKNQMILN